MNFTPKDIFLGQLAGCLESLDAGTTCIVDNCHVGVGPDRGQAALSASIVSGARITFCYGVSPLRASKWTDSAFELDMDPLPTWLLTQLEEMAKSSPFGEGNLVDLGFFFDSYFLPHEMITKVILDIKKLGIKTISSHFRHWPLSEGQSKVPETLDTCSLLGPSFILAHGNGTTPTQAALLTKAGTYLVCTPDTEVSMASGADPIAFREDLPLTCLGADCHSAGPASMLHQMQTALLVDRAAQVSHTFARGKYPLRQRATVESAFNLATIKAARAAQKDKEIGSIEVGKFADIVLFDTNTPAMACAAEQDPVAAVVRHATTREVDTVIVGGNIRKQDGKLVPVDLKGKPEQNTFSSQDYLNDQEVWSWNAIAKELEVSRRSVEEKTQGVNMEIGKAKLSAVMGDLSLITE